MSSLASATVAVAAGATTKAVTLALSLPYQITVSPAWMTDVDIPIGTKLATGFTVNFAVPAPAGGSSFDYLVRIPSTAGATNAVQLSDYLDELRMLLHDPNDLYWSSAVKTAAINRGIAQRDLDTQGNRTLVSFTLTAQQDTYDLVSDLAQQSVIDIIGLNIIWGNMRIVLGALSFTELNLWIRQQSPSWASYPVRFARRGPTKVILAPAPASAYVSEWDVSVFSDPLVFSTDTDPLPYPYTKPVAYYAAYLCKLNERQMEEAADFKAIYDANALAATNARAGMVPSPYGGGIVNV